MCKPGLFGVMVATRLADLWKHLLFIVYLFKFKTYPSAR